MLLCLVLAFVLLGACSQAEPQASPRPQPLPTDFTNGGDCEPLELERLPSDAGCATEVTGDADGDGSIDTLTLYARIGEDLRPRSWHLLLRTSDAASDQELDAGTDFSYPRAIGSADVNDDGRSEFFVKTLDLSGHGTAWKQLNLFVFQGSKLAIVTNEGDPLALRIGGITRMGEGVACPEHRLALLRAEAQNIRNTRSGHFSADLHPAGNGSSLRRTNSRGADPLRLQRSRSRQLLPAQLRLPERFRMREVFACN